jgi:hypothetical protein
LKDAVHCTQSGGFISPLFRFCPSSSCFLPAGTKDGHLCTLLLTEGDSAKALAVSGLSIVGRDRYGVFPLKGKLLNVREASMGQLMANSEITALKQILGLQTGKKYTTTKDLRYGRVMIMAGQLESGATHKEETEQADNPTGCYSSHSGSVSVVSMDQIKITMVPTSRG